MTLTRAAAAVIGAAALAAPASAQAITTYGNGFYTVQTGAQQGFEASTGNDHSAGGGVDLVQRGVNVVRDYTAGTDSVVASSYLGAPEINPVDDGRGFYQEWAAGTGSNATPLTFRRTTTTEGTTEAESLIRTTLSITNTGSATHVIGAQTALDDLVAADDTPVFTPWRGIATTATAHFTSPAFKQFDLTDDSARLTRGPGFPTVRSTWSVARPDLGATTPDLLDQEPQNLNADTTFAPANTTGTDLSTNRSATVWTWGPTTATARTVSPGATVSFTVVMVAEPPTAQPANATLPTIEGAPAVGTPLGSTVGSWTTTTRFTQYDRQWLRCDASGETCVAIPGATGQQYTPTAEDAGHVLRLDVTADRGPTVRSAVSVPVPAAAPATAGPASTPIPTAAPAPAKPRVKDGKATVLFPSSSARLTAASKRTLRKLAAGRPTAKRLTCRGYTASANGSRGYRTSLGLRRAKAVCAYLATRVDAKKVVATTKAGADPVASNKTRKGRALNRRVVVTIDAA